MENSTSESLPTSPEETMDANSPDEENIAVATAVKSTTEAQPSSASFKNPAQPYTALSESLSQGVGSGPKKMRFFGPRFMTIWVMPIAVTGILMEFLFVGPLRNANPFN